MLPIGEQQALQPYKSPSTAFQIMGAAYDLAIMGETSTSAIALRKAQEGASGVAGAKVLPADEINKMFPRVGATAPMNSGLAAFVDTELEEKERLQAIIANGNGSIFNKVAAFAGGISAHMTDPIDAAVGVATSGLGRMATAGKALSTGAKLGLNTAENVAGNLLAESLVYAAKREAQEEYTAEDFFHNVVTTSFVFAAGATAVGKMMDSLGGRNVDTLSVQTDHALRTGKDPVKMLDSTTEAMRADLHDEGFVKAFKETFPEMVEEDVNVRQGFKYLQNAMDEGRIDAAGLEGFANKLDEYGFDRAKARYAQDNAGANYSDDFINNLNETSIKRETDLGYSVEAQKDFDSVVKPADKPINDVDIAARETALAEAGDTATIEALKSAEQLETKKLGAMESYFNCILGVG